MRRILIVNQNWLGDVLFSTPAIRAVRAKFPESHLACLVPARAADVLRRNPHLNEVLVYDTRANLATLLEPFRLWRALRKRRFDTAIFFRRTRSKAFLAKLAGICSRIGYARSGNAWLLTQAVTPPSGPVHKIDFFLHLLEKAGIPGAGRWPEFYPAPAEEAALAELLLREGVSSGEPYAVLHAGGNWHLKRWPVEHFIRWTKLILAETKLKIILGGTASEQELAGRIVKDFPGGRVISLCGKTSLAELGALLKHAQFLLSNDSGPIHLAASQRTRILGLYGPTSPEETGPVSQGPVRILRKDVGCRVPCYFHDCDHRVCMELLTPEEVMAGARELLSL